MKITYTEAAVHRLCRFIYGHMPQGFYNPSYDELPDRIKGELSYQALKLLRDLLPLLEVVNDNQVTGVDKLAVPPRRDNPA